MVAPRLQDVEFLAILATIKWSSWWITLQGGCSFFYDPHVNTACNYAVTQTCFYGTITWHRNKKYCFFFWFIRIALVKLLFSVMRTVGFIRCKQQIKYSVNHLTVVVCQWPTKILINQKVLQNFEHINLVYVYSILFNSVLTCTCDYSQTELLRLKFSTRVNQKYKPC